MYGMNGLNKDGDELISRQAAIDAIKPWLNVEDYSEGEGRWTHEQYCGTP